MEEHDYIVRITRIISKKAVHIVKETNNGYAFAIFNTIQCNVYSTMKPTFRWEGQGDLSPMLGVT